MGGNRYVSIILILMLFICSCCAYEFIVGGRDGYWVSNPSENYNHWAQRMRFQVNDTLLFKYKEAGSDSVVEVNKLDDYEKCNSTNGHFINDHGNNSSSQIIFTFDRSGPFYFITANKTNCDKGKKLIIVVMAVRNRPPPNVPAAPPSEPPADSGPSENSSTPDGNGGGARGNTPVPAAAPPSEPPATGHAPAASGPSANTSTPGGGSSTRNTPADEAPPPHSFAAASYAPSVVLVSAVSLLFSVVLGGWNIYY